MPKPAQMIMVAKNFPKFPVLHSRFVADPGKLGAISDKG